MTRSISNLAVLPKYLGGIILVSMLASATVHGASAEPKAAPDAHAATTNAPSSTTHTWSKTIVIGSPDDAADAAQAAASAITKVTDEEAADGKPHESKVVISVDHGDKKGDSSALSSFMDSIIPICGIVGSFGMPVLIVLIVFYFRYRRRRDNLALAREFLAKGLAVPPELLANDGHASRLDLPPVSRARYDIRKGVMWTFVGLGVSLALYVNDPRDTDWGWGLIPMIIGLGFLAAGWLDQRQNGKGASS